MTLLQCCDYDVQSYRTVLHFSGGASYGCSDLRVSAFAQAPVVQLLGCLLTNNSLTS